MSDCVYSWRASTTRAQVDGSDGAVLWLVYREALAGLTAELGKLGLEVPRHLEVTIDLTAWDAEPPDPREFLERPIWDSGSHGEDCGPDCTDWHGDPGIAS